MCEFVESEELRVACKGSGVVGRKCGLQEVGRIGEYAVKGLLCAKILYILLHDFDALTERTLCHILSRLADCLRVYFHPNDLCLWGALGCHEGKQSATSADVKNATGTLDLCPRTKEHAVGAHLLGAPAVVNRELFELKHGTKIHIKIES